MPAKKDARNAATSASKDSGKGESNCQPKVCDVGAKILALSKGRIRIPLNQLAAATFNRFGQATSGKHCQKLMTTILKCHGFQEYRYVAGWCHTPNPQNKLQVWEHNQTFAPGDALLPTYAKGDLYGVFRKTHLVTGCQMVMAGDKSFSDSSGLMDVSWANACLKDVFEHGIFMEVFDYADTVTYRDEFLQLMASDNLDSDMTMPEDEISVLQRMHHAMRLATPTEGSDLRSAVRHEVERYGCCFSREDLNKFYDFCRTTPQEVLETFTGTGLHRLLCNPAAFYAPPTFFASLAKCPADATWLRLAFLVWAYGCDRGAECDVVGKKYVSKAVTKVHFEAVAKLDVKIRKASNAWLGKVLHQFLIGTANQQHPIDRQKLLPAVGTLLVRVAKLLVSTKRTEQEKMDKFAEAEHAFREALGPAEGLPPPILELPKSENKAGKKARTDSASSALNTTPLTFVDGELVANAPSRAHAAGICDGCKVVMVRQWNNVAKGEEGVVQSIHDAGIEVKWMNNNTVTTTPAGVLRKHVPAPPPPTPTPEIKLPDGFGWKLASSQQSNEVLECWAKAALYKACVSVGAGPEVLRLVRQPKSMLVTKPVAKGALLLVPFTTKFAVKEPAIGKSAKVTITVESQGSKQTHVVWALPFEEHGEDKEAEPPVHPAISPYWWVADLAFHEGCELLVFKKVVLEVPLNANVDLPGWKKLGAKFIVKVSFQYLTNDTELDAGAHLCPNA